eukprot:14055471-Ditylum_brightwellii.AAC.1
MAQFAQRRLGLFCDLMKGLELSLGPGMTKLGMRMGVYSGPVTMLNNMDNLTNAPIVIDKLISMPLHVGSVKSKQGVMVSM